MTIQPSHFLMRKQVWRNEGLNVEWPDSMAPAPLLNLSWSLMMLFKKMNLLFQIYIYIYNACVYTCTCVYCVNMYVCTCMCIFTCM